MAREKRNQDPIGIFADQCCKDKDILKCKTRKEVFNEINNFLQTSYKGRASVEHIKNVADDVTESVCIKLGIEDK